MGRPEFQQIVAQVPNEHLVFLDKTVSGATSVKAGIEEQITIYAPANKVNTVSQIYIQIAPVPNATSGNHTLHMMLSGHSMTYVYGTSSYNLNNNLFFNTFQQADVKKLPNEDSAQILQIQSIQMDDTNGLTIGYQNNTNTDQTTTRYYYVLANQREVGGSN